MGSSAISAHRIHRSRLARGRLAAAGSPHARYPIRTPQPGKPETPIHASRDDEVSGRCVSTRIASSQKATLSLTRSVTEELLARFIRRRGGKLAKGNQALIVLALHPFLTWACETLIPSL